MRPFGPARQTEAQAADARTRKRVVQMESVRAIQECVDENKETMSMGVVTTVQKECQKLYDIHSSLYKLHWTVVTCAVHHFDGVEESDTAKELLSRTQTIIVEAVDNPPVDENGDPLWHGSLPDQGKVLKCWVKHKMPYHIQTKHQVIIVHSVESFCKKRGRSDEDA